MVVEKEQFLPYGRHWIDDADIATVVEVLKSGWLTTGPNVEMFEKEFSKVVGVKHAVACSSGTAALHLSAHALGLGRGDIVVVPSNTFLATANAVRFVGAEVMFADVDPDTGIMNATHLEQAINQCPSARAAFPVHYAGQCVDMREVAGKYAIEFVEDGCHALGSNLHHDVGGCQYSKMTVFSMHPVKAIAAGEGGVVTTNDTDVAACLRAARSHGMHRNPTDFENDDFAFDENGELNPWYYEMHTLGFNYRISDIHCALARSQLRKLNDFISRRRQLADRYDDLLSPLMPLVKPIGRVAGCTPAWHIYPILIDFKQLGKSRAQVMNELQAEGIGTQVHYIPVHRQPYYRKRYGKLHLPGADAYYSRTLSLPLYPAMQDVDLDRVVSALIKIFKQIT